LREYAKGFSTIAIGVKLKFESVDSMFAQKERMFFERGKAQVEYLCSELACGQLARPHPALSPRRGRMVHALDLKLRQSVAFWIYRKNV
jgi:hypothetical protein